VARRLDQTSPDARRVTDEGQQALHLGLARLHAAVRLEGHMVPALHKAKRQFIQRDYEEAVFAAFRTVEEAVRERANMSTGDLGVRLMRQAFKPGDGPLTDKSAEPGEQEAISALFAGAIGASKTRPVTGRSTMTVRRSPPMSCSWPISCFDCWIVCPDLSPTVPT
jgi:uncharacterized protein (TIGR02391 family)